MKNFNFTNFFCLMMMSVLMSSCEAIMGIFKAGMGVGVFAVVALLLLVVFFVSRMGKNKNS